MKLHTLLGRLWTRKRLPNLKAVPAYRATLDAEAEALKRGDTRAIHRARQDRKLLILNALRGAGAG